MIRTEQDGNTRSIHAELECDAPPSAVWKALTDQRELVNWFPFAANVDPRVGGRYVMSWRGMFDWVWENKVEAIEPEKRLRLALNRSEAQLEKGTPLHVMEFTLEGKGDKTILRLVESGFSTAAEWDDEFDSHLKGWTYELMALAHYLKYHRGKNRGMVTSMVSKVDVKNAFDKIVTALGINNTVENQSNDFVVGDKRMRGRTIQHTPGAQYSAEIEGLNRALFRITGEDDYAFVWVSLYDTPAAKMRELQKSLDDFFAQTFPDETRHSPMIQPFSPTASDSQLVGMDFGWV